MKSLDPIFPCDECKDAEATTGERSSCQATGRPCWRLHKFLREDLKCHTQVRTTELIFPAKAVMAISDYEQVHTTRLTWLDLADSQIDYQDIQKTLGLTDGEKEMLQTFQREGLSHKDITEMYNISRNTFRKILKKVKRQGHDTCGI